MLAMRKRDLEQLERRSERTAAALNFIGVLASPEWFQALLQKAPPKWVHAECKRAVALCREMARGITGATVNPSLAKHHLEELEGALVRGDVVSLQRHAAAALSALGFELPPEETPHAPPKARAAKGAAASQRRSQRRGKKSRE